MTYPLSEIEGLTAYSASKLKSLGIRTTEALLEAARTVKGRKSIACGRCCLTSSRSAFPCRSTA